MNQYIHYGASKFDKTKFKSVKNTGRNKPLPGTGFWASPIDSPWGWKDWCISENFMVNKLEKHFIFSLDESARIFHIRSVYDLKYLPRLSMMSELMIDFETISKDYDAIQLHLSDEKTDKNELGLYYRLYGWDCDSILIMNPEIIVYSDE